ncbi:GTP-binding protein [Tanacetum coccineum]
MLLQAARIRLLTHHIPALLHPSSISSTLTFKRTTVTNAATKHPKLTLPDTPKHTQTILFIPPGTDPEQVTEDIILPNSNIVLGPYAGDAKVKEVQFIGSSVRPKDCPKDDRPEFAMLGRSNVGKSSLINSLVRKKEVALTSKKPGKTQLINHFLVNRSWYLVDLPGYG